MPWGLVGFRTTLATLSPGGHTTTFLPFPIHENDLLLVAVGASGSGPDFIVGDDAPSPGDSYNSFPTIDTPNSLYRNGMQYAYCVANLPSLTLTVENDDGSGGKFTVVLAVFRPDYVPINAYANRVASTDDAPSDIGADGNADNMMFVAWCVQETTQVVSVDSPLSIVENQTLLGTVRGALAWGAVVPGSYDLVMHLQASSGYAYQTAGFYWNAPPPSPRVSSSFLGSGLEPFPMRRKPEGRVYGITPRKRRSPFVRITK